MDTIKRTKAEYGGFLPLELNPGKEFFARYGEDYLLRFNSVKAAITFVIGKTNPKRIHVPFYYCPSTIEAIRGTGVEIVFYHINEKLMPESIPDNVDEMVLLVDYFGIKTEDISALGPALKKCTVLFDNAHSFFSKPVLKPNVYNVYSAKKFFGIPDGAYLVSEKKHHEAQVLSNSSKYANYLLQTYEEGTNSAYKMKKEADRIIAADYACMSKMAKGLLENVDYDRVRRQRELNYQLLHLELKDINELQIPNVCAAYQYPLLISRNGSGIKKMLVKNKIFVSTLWSGQDLLDNGNEFEKNMSENAVFLPMDQRYDTEDMKYIVETVKEWLKFNL